MFRPPPASRTRRPPGPQNPQPAQPADVDVDGILKGMHLVSPAASSEGPQAQILAAGIALPLLAWLGYRPNASDGTAALSAVYCLLPVGFKLASAALAWRWRRQLEETE